MPYSIATIPANFPQGYVLDATIDVVTGKPNGHQLYVKERWKGLNPSPTQCEVGDRNPDGSVGEYWLLGCLLPGCEQERTSVLTTTELFEQLRKGRVVGTYQNGMVVLA
jgi:hypothetical protein